MRVVFFVKKRMAEPERLTRDKLLDLLDADDFAALWKRWELPESLLPSRKAPDFITALDARSTTTLLQDVLALRTDTLRMLRTVLSFLESQGSSARTRGALIVLADEFDLAPQQVDATLKWSERALRKHVPETWEALGTRLRAEVRRLFQKIDEVGRVEVHRRDPDYVDVHIRMVMHRPVSPSELFAKDEVKFDKSGLEKRKSYVARLAALEERVHSARERLPDEARGFATALRQLAREQRDRLQGSESSIARADQISRRIPKARLIPADEETWKRFEESVLFLSDVEELASSLPDVLRMDLFRDRPRLFELWTTVTVIRLMQCCGWRIELLSLRTSAGGREVWNLNYGKSKTPVARLTRKRDGAQAFLFYQLFRVGMERANMPDIALMPTEHALDRPIWIIDPKHSSGNYGRSDYEEVALRYHRTFHPQQTWVVEYYPRPRLDNPLVFADGASVIHDVSPEGAGHTLLLDALRELHGCEPVVMAVIDVSGSFASRVARVREDLRTQAARGMLLADEILWFSDDAVVAVDPPSTLTGKGTRFTPVLALIERLDREGGAPPSLRIYTDRGFNDVDVAVALEQLRRRGDAELVDLDC